MMRSTNEPSATYTAQSLTQLVHLRAETTPEQVAVWTGHPDFELEFKSLTYAQVLRAIDRLCKHYSFLCPPCPPGTVPPERIIAILNSTAYDMSLLEMALCKLGLAALLLSVNNSAAAVASLCEKTGATYILAGPKYEETAQQAAESLKEVGKHLEVVPETRFPLWGKGGVDEDHIEPYPAKLTPEQESDRTCVVLHSSGSTGFPKPNFISHYTMIANISSGLPYPAFSALPLYHGFGHFSGFRCFYYAVPFTLFFPHLPLTAANIVNCIKTSPRPREQQLAAVPYVFKLLAETEEGCDMLASFKCVSYAGAAVPDELGDRLVARGVNIFSIFGTTETGAILNSRRDFETDKAWNWVRNQGLIEQYLDMEPRGENLFEAVVKKGWPALITSNRPNGSYGTKDLFLRHPEHSNWYKYVARLDDTLTQTLGEKTNPVPIENAIRGNSPYIRECIVFGDGRPQVGCLLRPSEAATDIWQDREKYMAAVWPVIADANATAPSHSRILPEMVEILPIDTKIPVATKMSILRPACYKLFAPIIDAVYDRFEKGSGEPKRIITTSPEMEAFLIEIITSTLREGKTGIERDTDLFGYGVDSLQATRVRNVISKTVELGGKNLGQNVVYEYPSVTKLAEYLLNVVAGGQGERTEEQEHQAMLDMVEKWAAKIELGQAQNVTTQGKTVAGEVVVLTGATGSLGAYLVDELTSDPKIIKVICLSRAPSHAESLSRIQKSLKLRLRSIAASALDKITSYAADVSQPYLGLSSAEYESIRNTATIVIHNAWPVNFVLSIESFDSHIGGAVNLLNLCETSPKATRPKFFFASSISTRTGTWEDECSETFAQSRATAAGSGYGRSKWVVEKLCERAGQIGEAPVGVLRIGQLCGDTEHGVWNETEAWPLMMKTANIVNALPVLEEPFSWLPVNLAARAIREIVLSPVSGSTVYHVLNPDVSAPWSVVLEGMKRAGVAFTPIERREWLERVKANPDIETNPAVKLLAFYTTRLGLETEKAQMSFSVDRAAKVSSTIANCPAISPELVELWARHWKKTGFLV